MGLLILIWSSKKSLSTQTPQLWFPKGVLLMTERQLSHQIQGNNQWNGLSAIQVSIVINSLILEKYLAHWYQTAVFSVLHVWTPCLFLPNHFASAATPLVTHCRRGDIHPLPAEFLEPGQGRSLSSGAGSAWSRVCYSEQPTLRKQPHSLVQNIDHRHGAFFWPQTGILLMLEKEEGWLLTSRRNGILPGTL